MNGVVAPPVQAVTAGETRKQREGSAAVEHDRGARSTASENRESANERKARYHRQEVTSYWYIAGLLAISLFGALWVIIAMTLASR